MPISRNEVDLEKFNSGAIYPYELRRQDFQMAMQDTYDFFYDVNSNLIAKGLTRLDDFLRPAIMSGVLSDMLTAFSEVYLAPVTIDDFRRNARGELGTRTATLHKEGVKKLRENWIYRV